MVWEIKKYFYFIVLQVYLDITYKIINTNIEFVTE